MISGVIEVLVKSGRTIDAINLAYVFELTEQFEPVQLLKAYLRDVKKLSHARNVKISPGAQVHFSHFSFEYCNVFCSRILKTAPVHNQMITL